ncbi:4-aminobutyrate--2-oxoglutarate transaminase [Brevundimonas sp.]|uniref:4-aminobutyrate--2-oxoglutarate transaminase n=1 Tax=Brevundimonas sp. TaxID=1871086 RepID=UPI0017D3367F|nr:4-aminobutyrate--2-oxoglutarate transaminase [Brevundimonas sp.]MBA3049104.1 4-aminobutyrate--2-oxoglutarate transaminase [Brevundimonas sp.]
MSTNADLHARRLAAVPRGVATATQIFAARAENAELWDVEGRRYVDFAGGIAVLNTGHRHPRVLEAVRAQLDAYTHTAFQVVAYEPYVELAERLNALAQFDGPAKTIFFTTGAEAVENAVKMARAATGRSAVIAFTGGFHGRTLLTMAMTGKVVPYKRLFGPLPGEVFHAPFPVPQYGVTVEDSLRALEFLFRADVEPERVAAIIIEPVQGEGGFQPAPPELLRALREICDRHGILLISDEVQAGFARTGKMFGIEHSGVQPDMITVAKSLAGGFPLSGVIGRAAVMDAAEPGGLGGTYAGPPIACAAALAVLDVIVDEQLMARADAQGERIKGRLQAMSRRNDLVPIAGIRGPGAMVGFDIVRERGGGEPDGAEAKAVTVRALQKGLLLLSCGVHGETIRLLAPLTTPDAILDEGLDILEASLERLS